MYEKLFHQGEKEGTNHGGNEDSLQKERASKKKDMRSSFMASLQEGHPKDHEGVPQMKKGARRLRFKNKVV